MYVEALHLLKTQLQEKFIDKYEDLQALFTTNCQISELPSRTTGDSRSMMSKNGDYNYGNGNDETNILSVRKQNYTMYPDYNALG